MADELLRWIKVFEILQLQEQFQPSVLATMIMHTRHRSAWDDLANLAADDRRPGTFKGVKKIQNQNYY